jgi:polyvinyl alcohol dehydrogenase (cytochrome)
MAWRSARVLPVLLVVGWSVGCGNGDDSSATATPLAPTLAALDCSNGDAGDWTMYGQNVCNTRGGTAASDPITAKTVSKLKVKWMYTAAGDISATPAVVGGQVYVPDWGGNLTRLDAATGSVVWSKNVGTILGIGDGGVAVDAGGLDTGATRAFASPVSRVTPVLSGSSLIFGMGSSQSNATLAAIDKDTAALKWQTPLDMHPTALITGSPAIDGDTIYVGISSGEEIAAGLIQGYPCCSFRGSVVAVSASTGAIKWKTYTIEDSVYYNADHTPSGYAGVAVWSGTPTVDRKRHLIYVTTGNDYATPTPAPTTLPAGDHIESVLALDEDTGAIKWSTQMAPKGGDVWTLSNFAGPDYDLGCGANLFQATIKGVPQDVLGAGQKSGVYWTLNPDTGAVLWKTQVGPGGHLGGIHWGTAVDTNAVYVGVNDESGNPYTLGGSGPQKGMKTSVGSWAALDPATGKTIWQIANPAHAAPYNGGSVNGPLSIWNGVVFAGSMDAMGMMYALDATTGAVLWQFQSGSSVYSGPAIVNGVVYWGAGYPASRLGLGSSGTTQLYAFDVGP